MAKRGISRARMEGARAKKKTGKTKATTTVVALKRQFDAAHRHGTEALAHGDYDAFGEAVDAEKAIIEEQGRAIRTQQAKLSKRKATKKR